MGSFYANISLASADLDTVVRTLTALNRRAYVAQDGRTTVVFDEKIDDQDIDELERLTVTLSRELDCVALAACNHDDDVLLILLAEAGTLTDRYDSNPGYFSGEPGASRGGDARRLCAAFGVPENVREVEALLRRPREDIVFEIQRHRALQHALRLPERFAFLGYRYLSLGELPAGVDASTVRLVAPDANPRQVTNELMAAMQDEGKDLFLQHYALALHDASVPERFVPLFGVAHGNGHQLYTRLAQYVVSHKLVKGGWLSADDLLADLLGQRRFAHVALARLLRAALGIPPLSPDEVAAFQRGDVALLARIHQAMQSAPTDAKRRDE